MSYTRKHARTQSNIHAQTLAHHTHVNVTRMYKHMYVRTDTQTRICTQYITNIH